ncbi:MAG: hypothetical protein MR710_04815, partial [Bacteroidales bacterium]|nr:hypothetical protein [Bacteroidales bacterium]
MSFRLFVSSSLCLFVSPKKTTVCGASAPHDTTKPSKQRNSPSGVHFELSPEGEHVSFVNFLPSLDAFGGSAVEAECGLVVIFLLE